MRRTQLFISRGLLGLWIALFGALLFLLVFEARGGGVEVPFAGISIKTDSTTVVHLPNRIFTCTETEQQSQCQADIEGHLLVIALAPSSKADLSLCQARYDGNPLVCLGGSLDYAPMLSESFEITGLDLSPQQLNALQQKYWGTNKLLALGDSTLIQISLWFSIAIGVIAAYFAWLYPSRLSKGFAVVAGGFMTYQLVWLALASVKYAVIPHRLTVDTWNRVVDSGPIAAGVLVMVIVALLLRHRTNQVAKTLMTLSNGVGGAWIAGNILVVLLLRSGFVD